MFVDAGGAVGAGAGADGEFGAFEVAEEVLPLGIGGGAVLLGGAQGAAAGDEGAVGFDGLGGVDGVVAHCGVDVVVADDDLGDVGWQAGADGVGDEHAPEVVRGENQGGGGGCGGGGGGQGAPPHEP